MSALSARSALEEELGGHQGLGRVRVNRLAVACSGLGLVVVLASAAEGVARRPVHHAEAPAPVRDVRPGRLVPPAPVGRLHPAPHPGTGWPAAGPVLLAVAAVVVLLAALVLWRAWRRRSRRSARPARTGRDLLTVQDDTTAGPAAAADAPVVGRGISAALDLLAEHQEPGDAVVRAWLELERTAQDAGVVRTPAETPTEFTARLLGRVPADHLAVSTLLELYSRARFAGRTGEAADVRRARAALEALARSWQTGALTTPQPSGGR